jgi:hypothetical protein
MTTARIRSIRYDAARHVHEARVDLTRGGLTFRYPCELPGPEQIDAALLHEALLAQAMAMSDSRAL